MEQVPVENNGSTLVGDDRPRFFMKNFGRSKKELKIPPEFIQHHLNEMCDTDRATLKGPFDDTWTIAVHNKEKGTYLKHGWQDFIRYHSLGNSEILLFRHEGNFHFSVRIFDPNGLERVSESVTCEHQEAKCRLGKSRIAGIKLDPSESCKLATAFLAGIGKQGRQRENDVDTINMHPIEDESKAGNDKSDPINNLHQSEHCKHEEKRKPGRPRKIKVIDNPSLHQLESCNHAPEAASCGKRKRGRPRKKNDDESESCKLATAFLAGMRKQGRQQENDVDTINMHPIVDESEAGNDKFDPINNLHQSERCKHEEKRKPGRPIKNKVIDTPSLHELESCKHAPEAASCGKRKRGRPRKKKDDDLLHQSKSCQYGSDVLDGPGVGLSFPCHKLEKVKESMKVEDTTRKIKEREVEATDAKAVPLVEVKEEEKENDEYHSQTMRPLIEEGATALEKADSFISNFPFYKCSLKKTSVQKVFFLDIDNPFAEAHFPENRSETIVLRNPQGKGWVVTVIPKAGRHSFSGGWRKFVLDNGLKEGDVCIFELVKRGEMQVHVFRVS